MKALAGWPVKCWLGVAAAALVLSSVVQRYVEERRVSANLTWAETDKNALEAGLMALGGFRGVLADVLWVRAIRLQEDKRYYELKLLGDMILKLQPTFTQVHAFQAYNMSYNLAYRSENSDDRWYWIRSGLMTLENGLERNYRNYSLWFELGFQYFDRLGDIKLSDLKEVRQRELPNFDDLETEEERRTVFLKAHERQEKWAREGKVPRPARPDEYLRYAAYYFWRAMETNTDPTPLRTERVYGACIERLGHFWSRKKLADRHNWDDWGSEDWWVELLRRNAERGIPEEGTVTNHLQFCMYEQMDFFMREADREREKGNFPAAVARQAEAQTARDRFVKYFPHDDQTLEQLLTRYRGFRAQQEHGNVRPVIPIPTEH